MHLILPGLKERKRKWKRKRKGEAAALIPVTAVSAGMSHGAELRSSDIIQRKYTHAHTHMHGEKSSSKREMKSESSGAERVRSMKTPERDQAAAADL